MSNFNCSGTDWSLNNQDIGDVEPSKISFAPKCITDFGIKRGRRSGPHVGS